MSRSYHAIPACIIRKSVFLPHISMSCSVLTEEQDPVCCKAGTRHDRSQSGSDCYAKSSPESPPSSPSTSESSWTISRDSIADSASARLLEFGENMADYRSASPVVSREGGAPTNLPEARLLVVINLLLSLDACLLYEDLRLPFVLSAVF